ncbi:MAG: TonB-dependent receptor [Alphaproteobacteria bacterium]|nr:MAG: TonB-dependent receptor [Alphaproteobacteria bacterium]
MAATSLCGLLAAHPALAQDTSADSDAKEIEEITVTGFRASLADALSNKRNSNLFLESVTAEDIGKFPDQNVAESLQRLSGVQIDRDNGQGTTVRIRGLDQNVTVLNGEVFLTGLEVFRLGEGGDRKQDSLEGIPAELIGGVDVYKSPNASLLEGGLGGIINLKTRSPLALDDGLTVAGNGRMSKGSEIGGWEPTGAVAVGYKNEDKFGLIATASYDKQNLHTNVMGGDNRGNWVLSNRADAGTVQNYYAPEYRYVTDRDEERERWGFSLGAEARVTEAFTVEANWFHSDLTVATQEASIKYPMNLESPGLDPDYDIVIGANNVLERGTFIANSAEAISFVQTTKTKADNIQLGMNFDDGGRWRGSIKGAYAKSSMTSLNANNDVRYTQYSVPTADASSSTGYSHQAANPDAPANFRYTYDNGDGTLPSFTLVDVPDLFTNPAYGFFKSHWLFDNASDLENYSVRGDIAYDPEFISSGNVTISAGARYAVRDIDFEQARYLADYSGKGELDGTDFGQNWTPYGYFQDGAIGFKSCELPAGTPGIPGGCDNRFGNSPPLITPFDTFTSNSGRVETINGFWGGNGGGGTDTLLAQDRGQMVDGLAWIQSLYPDTPFSRFIDPLNSFKVKEKTTSGYLMADVGDEADTYHVNVGVRIVRTDLTVDQGTPAGADPTYWGTDSWNGVLRDADTIRTSRSYTDILPSANVVLNLDENSKVRASAARVVARQRLFDLGRGFETFFNRNPDTNLFEFVNGSSGNPELDPFRATQMDLGYEYYIGSEGLISVSGFWKEVDSFIVTNTVPIFVNDQAGGRLGPVSLPENGEGGRIRGFEIGGQYAFEWGGGFIANYTFSDSTSSSYNDFDEGLPIPGVSKHSANAQVYYQQDLFEARVSYTWRSKRYNGNFGFNDGDVSRSLGRWIRPYGQLDAQLVVHVTDNFDLTAEAVNITKEAQSEYLQFENLPFRYNSGPRRFLLGGRFRF